jgi:site-specific DNA-methyltransferase (adenine-specific)
MKINKLVRIEFGSYSHSNNRLKGDGKRAISGASAPVDVFHKIRLYRADCLDSMAQLPPKSVDLVLADLPYGATRQKWDKMIPCDQLWQAYARVCKPNANIIFTATMRFAANLITSNPKGFRYELVWGKNKPTGFLNASRMPLRQHELILIFQNTGIGIYHPQKSSGHPPLHAFTKHDATAPGVYGAMRNGNCSSGSTERQPTSLLHFPVVNNDDPRRIHRNQKPVSLLDYLIRSYSDPGDTVLDNTMGSGSTGTACINTGRNFIGIEKDAKYFMGAVKRIGSAAKAAAKNPTANQQLICRHNRIMKIKKTANS